MPTRLFVPSPLHEAPVPRVDEPDDLHDVLAYVSLHTAQRTVELVIGLDLGRVIRVVEAQRDELPPRARAQLAFHETKRPRFDLHADELHVMDVQAIERQPDAPGADDPLYVYGMLRGPYPAALVDGVVAREGQLATTRGPLLDGLALGVGRAFVSEHGRCGDTCVHALLPADELASDGPRSVVLAFPLVPMGEDSTNELVAAQLVHDVLGALRTDLGDDLANDPVPVPSRQRYEQELVAAGWTLQGDVAVHRGGKSRFASLFSPGKKQLLPREIGLEAYVPLIEAGLARLPDWATARRALHDRLGDHGPRRAPPPPPQARPIAPPVPPPPRARPPRAPGPPRTVAKGLTPELGAALWMQKLVEQHVAPARPAPRVAVPGRAAGAPVPGWIFDLIEQEFPDD